jgi:hypothetical protein
MMLPTGTIFFLKFSSVSCVQVRTVSKYQLKLLRDAVHDVS